MIRILVRMANRVPLFVKSGLKLLGVDKAFLAILDRDSSELAFQQGWAREFRGNEDKILEFWEKHLHLDEIRRITGINGAKDVLDVGCGISTILLYVPGRRRGIDPLAEEFKLLYTYPEEIEIRNGTGEDIPYPGGSFDVVFCTNVLDHVQDPEKTVANIHAVLKAGGFFVLTVQLYDESIKRDRAHPQTMTRPRIESLLAGRFRTLFEDESSWPGLRRYLKGELKTRGRMLIYVLQKV